MKGPQRNARRALVPAIVLCLAVTPAAAAKKPKAKPFKRAGEAVVVTGAKLPRLLGTRPADGVIAYSWRAKAGKKGKARRAGARKRGRYRPRGRWVRVPVQVDERAAVDFGQNPNNGSVPLTGERTVYGTPPLGISALQYTDPDTFVGSDPDPALDADDEVALMAADAGVKAPRRAGRPPGAVGAGDQIVLRDPINGAKRRLYLFRLTTRKLKLPRAADLVDYEFTLNSGDYRATYLRRNGPNPETSSVRTAAYTVGFSDRWYFDQLRINRGGATGAEILDGYKFAFNLSPPTCGRSEETFNDAEGAFVVNKDGPVRAIRSYVGANSGPYTQRTHLLYARRHEIVTDLRVHPVPGPFVHYDLSPAAAGMTYLNPTRADGVAVDGSPDPIDGGPAVPWHLWRGSQGSFFVADRAVTSIQPAFDSTSSFFYEDDSQSPSFTQCWGDSDLIGAAGIRIGTSIPDTDVGASDYLRATSVNVYEGPGASAADAAQWSRRIDRPLAVSVSKYRG